MIPNRTNRLGGWENLGPSTPDSALCDCKTCQVTALDLLLSPPFWRSPRMPRVIHVKVMGNQNLLRFRKRITTAHSPNRPLGHGVSWIQDNQINQTQPKPTVPRN